MRLNRLMVLLVVMAFVFLTQSAVAAPQTVFFSSATSQSPPGTMQFTTNNTATGASFSFPPALGVGNDFVITNDANFNASDVGVLGGLFGNITGTFSYLNSNIVTSSGNETAPVTGSGQFIIHDGTGHDFTSDLTWNDISTDPTSLNTHGTVNLTNFGYGGSNDKLVELAATQGGIITAQFDFGSGRSLLDLGTNCGAGCTASFNGSLTAAAGFGNTSAAPEPQFLGFLLVGALGAAGVVRRYLTA